MRMSSFRVNEESINQKKLGIPVGHWMPITKEPEESGTKYRFLKCVHCGHEDFNEGGERLNDYVCNGCDLTISVVEKRTHVSSEE